MDLETLRHSCSHVMAQAVKELWPGTKLAIGPAIADGFYYDFDKKEAFVPEDLKKIEARMKEIIAADFPFTRQEMTKTAAVKLFKKLKETYKLELLQEIPDKKVTVYKTGKKFVDLCRGPHVASTGKIKAFKLLSIAGAYWHGIETNPMLQRIYGTAFQSKEELKKHLHLLEEAKKRDHRKLGPGLGFFDIYQDLAGPGLVFYHHKGAILRNIIEDYEKDEHLKRGYQMVITPHIMKDTLWKQSGHYDYYKENMYTFKMQEQSAKAGAKAKTTEYVVKPMNCPGHMLIYKSKTRSYRDLPLRYFELGTVYRHEKSGVLHGLLRVRGFTQDDAHIFCTPGQLKDEIKAIIDFVFEVMEVFGFGDVAINLSTRPKEFIGSKEDWERATRALEDSLKEKKLSYEVSLGEGAFYGPKIDIQLKDALGRAWQCATIQCDFALPERFDLTYVNKEGTEQRPVMLHRVILGSIERFLGALLEHYGGKLPLWLSPVQVAIIPIAERHNDFAKKVKPTLETESLRTEIYTGKERMEKKIRRAEIEKIPYALIIGDKEIASKVVAVRRRDKGDIGKLSVENFTKRLKDEIRSRS